MTPGRDDARRSAERWRDRQTLERRLHDGPAQRLSALTLRLGVLRADAPGRNGDPADHAWHRGLDVFQSELESALQELREVAGALYPPLLDEAGLGPALRELVTTSGAVARVDVADVRCGTAAEGAAYFAVAACLAGADDPTPGRPEIGIRVRVENDDLVLTLTGVDPDQRRPVLDEAAPLGGCAELTGPAEITARFPCA